MKRGIALLLALLCLCAGCGKQEQELPVTEEIQIDPNEGAINSDTVKVRLYFANEDYSMLVGREAEVKVPVSSRMEYSILQALLQGPGTAGTTYNALVNPATEIIRIEESKEYTSITLNEQFLDWTFITETNLSVEATNRIKKLAVYSVVNSVIEATNCKKVQLLVDKDGSHTGQRITLAEVGMGGNGILEPMAHGGDLVLDAENTIDGIFEALIAKDYAGLYAFLAYSDEQAQARPAENSFSVWMQSLEQSVESYTVRQSIEPVEDGRQTVLVDYTVSINGEERKVYRMVPVQLVKENGLWRITYPTLKKLF